ncbi:unnamed protein product [Closterium sp. NIES-54]
MCQTFTLPASPQQNGIAECRIGTVMDVARTSMIHAAAPHFLWPFAVQYAAHQINIQPRVSLPETTPTLRWTGKVGDASVFRVWGSRAFVHDTSADKLSSRADLMFDELVSYYRLFPYRTSSLPPSPLRVLPPQRGEPGGAEFGGAESGCAEPGGAELERVEPGGTASGGAEPACAASGGSLGVPSRQEPLSLQQLCEWYTRSCRGAIGAGGTARAAGGAAGGATCAGATRAAGGAVGAAGDVAGAGAAGSTAGAGAAGGAAGTGGAGGAAGAGAAGACGGAAGAAGGAAGAGAAGGAAGAGAAGAAGDTGAVGGPIGACTGGTGAAGTGGAVWRQPYYVPLLQQVLGLPPPRGPTPSLVSPPPLQSQSHFQPASPLPVAYRTIRAGRCVSRPRPPPVPGTHSMTLRPSTAPQRVPLPSPPASSLLDGPDPESDSLPCRLDFTTSLVAESASASVCPPSIGGECALGTDVLEDRQEELKCFAAAVPHLVSMLLAPEGDPDAPDIPTPYSYAEAIEGPYSSQWQAAMDAKMASWKSTGTYVNEVPPPGANIVSGMWIFRVKWPRGSPPVFKARYVAHGFSKRQGVDFFQTFSPTPKMTTFWVMLHVGAPRDYELHSLDFSTAFLQGSLHKEIWLRRPPGFIGSFPAVTPSLPPFYVLVYVDDLVFATADTQALAYVKSELQKRHTCTDLGELRSYLGLQITRDRAQRTITLTQSHMVQQVLQCFGFTYSSPQSTPLPPVHSLSAPPSDESVEPSGPYPELVGCLMCTGMLRRGYCATCAVRRAWGSCLEDGLELSSLATQQSSQGYTFSLGSGSVSWRSTRSSSVLSSSCEAEIYAGAMAAQELRWLTYLLIVLGEAPRSPAVLYVDNKAMLALCQEHRLEHRMKHIALRYFLARELQQRGLLRLAYVASQALQPCDHQDFCTVLNLVPTVPHLLTS